LLALWLFPAPFPAAAAALEACFALWMALFMAGSNAFPAPDDRGGCRVCVCDGRARVLRWNGDMEVEVGTDPDADAMRVQDAMRCDAMRMRGVVDSDGRARRADESCRGLVV
jgi:hypothetical protein